MSFVVFHCSQSCALNILYSCELLSFLEPKLAIYNGVLFNLMTTQGSRSLNINKQVYIILIELNR